MTEERCLAGVGDSSRHLGETACERKLRGPIKFGWMKKAGNAIRRRWNNMKMDHMSQQSCHGHEGYVWGWG